MSPNYRKDISSRSCVVGMCCWKYPLRNGCIWLAGSFLMLWTFCSAYQLRLAIPDPTYWIDFVLGILYVFLVSFFIYAAKEEKVSILRIWLVIILVRIILLAILTSLHVLPPNWTIIIIYLFEGVMIIYSVVIIRSFIIEINQRQEADIYRPAI